MLSKPCRYTLVMCRSTKHQYGNAAYQRHLQIFKGTRRFCNVNSSMVMNLPIQEAPKEVVLSEPLQMAVVLEDGIFFRPGELGNGIEENEGTDVRMGADA